MKQFDLTDGSTLTVSEKDGKAHMYSVFPTGSFSATNMRYMSWCESTYYNCESATSFAIEYVKANGLCFDIEYCLLPSFDGDCEDCEYCDMCRLSYPEGDLLTMKFNFDLSFLDEI